MKYWWVNHNQTYRTEIPGGFLWSPKTNANGAKNQFYDNMRLVQPGDVIFSFCDTFIKAIGVATASAETSPKPDFGKAGASWSSEGWLVPVEFKELATSFRPKDHIDLIRPHLPEKYSPLQTTGNGLQSVYLAEVPAPMATVLIQLVGDSYSSIIGELLGEVDNSESIDASEEDAIKGRTDIGATTKSQLVKSRRGQGIFKANVRLNESRCRVTGIADPKHLRASHIKPWKDSSDEEKLNGCNGLLLAPHIDHLFDMGMISFTNSGDMIVSDVIDPSILNAWGIAKNKNVGAFNQEQNRFLEYHRNYVLRAKTEGT